MHVATPKLIEASAVLDPGSQALLNLWLHRGLTDTAIAELAGLDMEVIAARRLDIVNRLGEELGVRPYDVLLALAAIVHPPRETSPAADPARNGGAPEGSPPATPASEPEPSEPEPSALEPSALEHEPSALEPSALEPAVTASDVGPERTRRRRVLVASVVLAAAIVAGVVVVVSVSGTGSHNSARRTTVAETADPSSTPSTDPSSTPSTDPSSTPSIDSPVPASDGSPQPLEPLSSRAPQARGTVVVTGAAGARQLNVTVSGLPPVTGDHYEVWLYKTIIDAHALGPIPTGVTRLSLPLPADAARYPLIDISVQPPHYAYDSGESVLRAKNPTG